MARITDEKWNNTYQFVMENFEWSVPFLALIHEYEMLQVQLSQCLDLKKIVLLYKPCWWCVCLKNIKGEILEQVPTFEATIISTSYVGCRYIE